MSTSREERIAGSIVAKSMTARFEVGDRVKLREDVLKRHAQRVPAHAGFTTTQFEWRELLDKLAGQEGEVTRPFAGSKHVNVQFNGVTIGIDDTELVLVRKAKTASFGRWKSVKDVTNEISNMSSDMTLLLEKEREAVSSGEARFDNSHYYQVAINALDECWTHLQNVASRL